MKISEISKATSTYINGLLVNWIIICTAIALPIALAPWLNRQFTPMLRLAEIVLLIAYLRSNAMRSRPICMRPVYVIISVMIVVAIISLTINIMHVKWLFGTESGVSSSRLHEDILNFLPSLNILVLGPVMAIVGLWGMISGRRSSFCLECRSRYSFATDDGFVGQLLRSESSYQIRTIFYIGLFLSVVEWIYYTMFFINININTPDRFMLTALPLAILTLSVFYMIGRYMAIWAHYNSTCRQLKNCAESTEIRYMIITDGKMLLTDSDGSQSNNENVDTPAIIKLNNTSYVSNEDARRRFEELSGVKNFSMRYIYQSSGCNAPTKVLHYVVTIEKASDIDNSLLKGKWYNAFHIENLIHTDKASLPLSGAIRRIYIITMAWKTYDAKGRRLYPIKNYRPTFRLKDFDEWVVDYDDAHWINVACNNQDSLMYHLRDFWRKYVRSIGC